MKQLRVVSALVVLVGLFGVGAFLITLLVRQLRRPADGLVSAPAGFGSPYTITSAPPTVVEFVDADGGHRVLKVSTKVSGVEDHGRDKATLIDRYTVSAKVVLEVE